MKIGIGNFNWNYFIYALIGFFEIIVGMKFIFTQKGRGVLFPIVERNSFVIAGIFLIILGVSLVSVPFLFKGNKSQLKKVVDFVYVFIGILTIEFIAAKIHFFE